MRDAHLIVAAVIWFTAMGAVVEAARFRKRSSLPVRFWQIQGILQIAVLVQAALGLGLMASGFRPKDGLHFLYGALTLLMIAAERGLMPGRTLREAIMADWGRFSEPWVYLVLNFLVWALASRAVTTGLWGF